MKIKFTQQHIVRGETRAEDTTYEEGQVADFGKDPVANTYATAYIERGYAAEYDEAAVRTAEKAAREERAKADEEVKTKATADAKEKSEAEAKAKSSGGQSSQ